ncbi:MAG: ribulose-phosphate 3-epimerase [Euryarchaeota archaeon RBG_13_57_23]|nr:MAG: ribulose-phosphate 3-epimerase [Euryarchaeota archaeon RBG_13_57_23]
MPLVAPSILAADFANLGEEVRKVSDAGADFIHVDVMDGIFVPNITVGPSMVKAIRGFSKLPFIVHLMITHPENHVKAFAESGSDIIEVHIEAEQDLRSTIRLIHDLGKKVGLAVNPPTPIESAFPYLKDIDMLLVMSVNPGFGGQTFIPGVLPKIPKAKEEMRRQGYVVPVEIDGGITPETGEPSARAGADILAAGTSVFKAPDVREAIRRLRECGASKL